MTQALTKAGFGWRRSPDPRDKNFPFRDVVPMGGHFPGTRTRHYFKTSHVLDQGRTASAVLFALRHWLETVGIVDDALIGPSRMPNVIRHAVDYLFKRGLILGYFWTNNAEEIARAILHDVGPVLLGLYWRHSMDAPLPDGTVSVDGAKIGAHCVLVVGYDYKRRAFRCLNSWGAGWGQRGRFWIAAAEMQTLLDEGGEACLPVKAKA